MEKLSELEVIKLTDAKYMNTLEQAIEYGEYFGLLIFKRQFPVVANNYFLLKESTGQIDFHDNFMKAREASRTKQFSNF